MGRKDAERLLLLPGNQRGTYLVRESETTKGKETAMQQEKSIGVWSHVVANHSSRYGHAFEELRGS